MGCVQAKGTANSPLSGLERLKRENNYIKGGNNNNKINSSYNNNGYINKSNNNNNIKVSIANRQEGNGRNENGVGGNRVSNGGERRISVSSSSRSRDKGDDYHQRKRNYHNNSKSNNNDNNSNSNNNKNNNEISVPQKIPDRKMGGEEWVDGWPKWLVDNIPKDVLDALQPKSADSYDKLSKVGQGTYSNVYKARDRNSGKIVALKKVRFDTSESESVKFMAREIIILQKLNHPNIIKLEGIATSRMQYSLYLVFDFMPSDLSSIISRPDSRLTEPQVKCYMHQLLSGLQHCHERGILHRDIKGSNLLIDKEGRLKIADFGLANFYEQTSKTKKIPQTNRVVTLWYRAPELLLGSTDYGPGIDLWSAGCLLAEMFHGCPILPGRNEIEQLHKIFKLCGSPPEEYWKKVRPPTTFRPPQQYKASFHVALPDLPESSFGLLSKLLCIEPAYRGSAASALQNQFFKTSPLACDLTGLPVINVDVEAINTDDRKRSKASKSKQSRRGREKSHRRRPSIADLVKDDSTSKEEKQGESSTQSQELSFKARSSRTEAHPNALKNIKNYPILLASITEHAKHYEDNRLGTNRRSISTVDFRGHDLDDISKFFM